MGKPFSVKMIKYVDPALKALETVYFTNGTAVYGLAYIKEVGKGKSVSWGGVQTKGEGRDCKITKKMFFHNDLLQSRLRNKHNITELIPDTTVFTIKKLCRKLTR